MWNSSIPNISENTNGFQWLNKWQEKDRKVGYVEIYLSVTKSYI
jgi:hypothetical protein